MSKDSVTLQSSRIRRALESSRKGLEGKDSDHWPFFDGGPLSKKAANKFLLGCFVDFQWPYQVAWERARALAEDELHDPADLWKAVVRIPRAKWNGRKGSRSLHRFGWRHNKIWDLAETLRRDFAGDARRIWTERSPLEVLDVLENEIGTGPQVGRMTVGALIDEGEIHGSGQVKADIHVRRTLGRAFLGGLTSVDEASKLARLLDRINPWRFDYLLWRIGRDFCKARNPGCGTCPLRGACHYAVTRHRARVTG